MRLFLKYLMVLTFAATGFFSFYLVIINFLENIDSVSKGMLFLRLGASIILAACGAIVFSKLRAGAIIAIVCLLCLGTLWMDFGSLSGDINPEQNPDTQQGMLEKMFPTAYVISLVLSIAGAILPVPQTRKSLE